MMEVGIIGWRGMVGSVLLERMRAERDFDRVDPVFFSTSQAGGTAPDIGRAAGKVQDANDLAALKRLPMLISTQGEIIPRRSMAVCANRDGRATGSMRHRPCGWRPRPSSFSTRSILP